MKLLKLLPRFRRAYASLREQEEREGWSRVEIESYQLERLNHLWSQATSHVSRYKQIAQDHALPAQFDSLEQFCDSVPILTKESVKDNPEKILSDQKQKGKWYATGGSTGTPTRVYWSNQAHLRNLRTRYRCQMMWGVDILDRQAMLWGQSALQDSGPTRYLSDIAQSLNDLLRERLQLSAYQLGNDDLQKYLKQIKAFKPRLLYGYASAISLLAEQAKNTGWRCPELKLCILSGEPVYPELVHQVESALDVNTSIEYGSMECGVIANQWPDSTLRVRDDEFIVETVPRGDGYYHVVITVLFNPSFPLLRYQIGDVTEEPILKNPNGFGILKQVTGRENDILISKTGRRVHACSVRNVLDQYPNLRRYHAHQLDTGTLEVLLEPSLPGTEFDASDVIHKMESILDGYSVKLKIVEKIPPSPAGKHRWIVSDLRI